MKRSLLFGFAICFWGLNTTISMASLPAGIAFTLYEECRDCPSCDADSICSGYSSYLSYSTNLADCAHMCQAIQSGDGEWVLEEYSNIVDLCSAGNYMNEQFDCTKCPKGTYMHIENLRHECFACPSGYTTSSTGAQSSSACTVQTGGGSSGGNCGAGYYDDAGCMACTDGYYGTDGVTCSPCPKGTYAQGMANTYCSQCPMGYTTPYTGASDSDQCEPVPIVMPSQGNCSSGYVSVDRPDLVIATTGSGSGLLVGSATPCITDNVSLECMLYAPADHSFTDNTGTYMFSAVCPWTN